MKIKVCKNSNNKMYLFVKLSVVLHLVLSSYQLVTHTNLVDATTVLNLKNDVVKLNRAEIDNMNLKVLEIPSRVQRYSSQEFLHHDEDQTASVINNLSPNQNYNNLDNLKYEIEMLEPLNDQRTDDELEEHFKGAGVLQTNAITLTAENIEVDGRESNNDKENITNFIATQKLTFTLILVAVVMLSISLYAGVVIWRSHLERRYGMRQLLVSINNEDYIDAEHENTFTPTVLA